MYIRVDNKREGSSVDLVDTIFVDATLSPNSSLPAKVYNGDFVNGNIEVGFRVTCSKNYSGNNCTKYCVPGSAHYYCTADGMKCNAGYQNPSTNCTECVPAHGCCKWPRIFAESSHHPILTPPPPHHHPTPHPTTTPSPHTPPPPPTPKSITIFCCAANIGGYCTQPGECVCRPGFSGSLCGTSTLHNMQLTAVCSRVQRPRCFTFLIIILIFFLTDCHV